MIKEVDAYTKMDLKNLLFLIDKDMRLYGTAFIELQDNGIPKRLDPFTVEKVTDEEGNIIFKQLPF